MPKAVGSADLYMNFSSFKGALDGTDSTTLVEVIVNTGLHVRASLIWLIHLVEAHVVYPTAAVEIQVAFSTRQKLASIPELGDNGLIALFGQKTVTSAGGFHSLQEAPQRQAFLPPVPLATPAISMYLATVTDVAGVRGQPVAARLGFTTAPLDAQAYTEIVETWGWQ